MDHVPPTYTHTQTDRVVTRGKRHTQSGRPTEEQAAQQAGRRPGGCSKHGRRKSKQGGTLYVNIGGRPAWVATGIAISLFDIHEQTLIEGRTHTYLYTETHIHMKNVVILLFHTEQDKASLLMTVLRYELYSSLDSKNSNKLSYTMGRIQTSSQTN